MDVVDVETRLDKVLVRDVVLDEETDVVDPPPVRTRLLVLLIAGRERRLLEAEDVLEEEDDELVRPRDVGDAGGRLERMRVDPVTALRGLGAVVPVLLTVEEGRVAPTLGDAGDFAPLRPYPEEVAFAYLDDLPFPPATAGPRSEPGAGAPDTDVLREATVGVPRAPFSFAKEPSSAPGIETSSSAGRSVVTHCCSSSSFFLSTISSTD